MRLILSLLFVIPLLAGGVAAEPARITAVTGPLAAIAGDIAGDVAQVDYPVPPETDPALWRPAVADVTRIQESDLILLNGAGLSAWTAKTSLPRSRTVDTSRQFKDALIETEMAVTHSHGTEGEHSHTGTAPQVWMDFSLAALQAEAIATALKRAFPQEQAGLAQRAETVQDRLAVFHTRATTLGTNLQGKTVLVAHPGLEYFLRAYGITPQQLGWTPGTAPDPLELDDLVTEFNPVLIFWQIEPTAAAREAMQTRGIVSVVLDPAADDPDAYWSIMDSNLNALEAAVANM